MYEEVKEKSKAEAEELQDLMYETGLDADEAYELQ